MLIQGQVGPLAGVSGLSDGLQSTARMTKTGELAVSELQPRYYEGTYRRTRFSVASTSGTVTTAALATTYTGLCLSNPVGNSNNIVLEKVGVGFLVAFAAASAYGLMCGFNSSTNVTHTTPVTPRSNFIGIGASPTALVDSSATLPTAPVLTHVFGAGLTGAITTTPLDAAFFDLEGSVILPPGAYAAIFTSTVSGAASLWASFQWSEVPI